MPAAARGQAEQVRSAVAGSMEELMDQARRVAEETEAIDAAFQSRVRRNYEMLSEAVRLMSGVAAPIQPLSSEPEYRQRTPRAKTSLPPLAEETPVETKAPEPVAELAPEPEVEAAAAEQAEPEPAVDEPPDLTDADLLETPATPLAAEEARLEATGAALRPRLKLTPTATDEEFTSVFGPASGKGGGRGDEGWTWKDLLTSIDEADDDPASLEARLTSEITGMGIDPGALLPKGRIDEIAAAVQTGDSVGARQVVRKLAPAATRRIARRLSGDAKLRRQVDAFLDHFETQLGETMTRDPAGLASGALLGSEGGRAYLLFDAALSD
jgi:hypothetical protein